MHLKLNPGEFYDKYAPIIYGSICRMTQDKAIAEKIFAEVIIYELKNQPAGQKENVAFTAMLLRRVYQFTTRALERYGIQAEGPVGEHPATVLDLLCSKHATIKATSFSLNMPEADVMKALHLELLKYRNKRNEVPAGVAEYTPVLKC